MLDRLAILPGAGIGMGGVDDSRVEIKPRTSGNMQLTLMHKSSVLDALIIQPDYTIEDGDAGGSSVRSGLSGRRPMAADRDLRTFIACGRALGGDNWHGEMARLTRFTRPYITMIANVQRPVTDEVKAAIKKGLKQERRKLMERAYIVTKFLQEYE